MEGMMGKPKRVNEIYQFNNMTDLSILHKIAAVE